MLFARRAAVLRIPAARALCSAADVVTVTIADAESKTKAALMKIGWDDEDAGLQAKIMTAAELCGNNQGLVKMYNPALMAPSPNTTKPTIERDGPTSAVVNANQSPGMLAAVTAADLAIKKVKENGPIAIVSAYNAGTSSGQLAFYTGRIAEAGYIGVAMANSPEWVAAAPGGKGVFGTNPVAFGVPHSGGPPMTFDMATSAYAMFGILTSKAKGEPLPDGVAYGKDGKFTTDASEVLEGGAIATFGGHKGAGLALCVELLAGVLSGGAVLGQESKLAAKSWGHTIIAINPAGVCRDPTPRNTLHAQRLADCWQQSSSACRSWPLPLPMPMPMPMLLPMLLPMPLSIPLPMLLPMPMHAVSLPHS